VTGRPLILLAVCWLLAPPVQATTVRHLDTRALARGSHEIVIGQVERVASRWEAGRTRIVTDVTIRVTRPLKGVPVERLTLTQLGGEVDGVRVTVHASPVFTPGEEALVFVWRDPRGRAQVNGLAPGKFEIRTDARTGRRYVRRSAPGFAVRDARTLARAGRGERPLEIGLETLVREIERALGEEGGR